MPTVLGRSSRPLIIVILLLLVAEAAVRVGASHLPPPATWSTPEAQVKVDQMHALEHAGKGGGVVFISSSVLDVGFDPAAFAADSGTHASVYNAALSGSNLVELRWWLDHVVLPDLHPRLVVIGMSSREVNANDPAANEIASQFFASDPVRHVNGDESIMQRLERYGDDVSDLFRYRKVLRDPEAIVHHLSPVQAQERFLLGPQGQQLALTLVAYHDTPSVNSTFRTTFFQDWSISPERLGALTGMLSDVKAAGAQAVVLDVPVTAAYISLHPDGGTDYAAYEHALAGVASAAHAPLIPSQVWATSYFADPLHLNETGARHLAAGLATQLKPFLP